MSRWSGLIALKMNELDTIVGKEPEVVRVLGEFYDLVEQVEQENDAAKVTRPPTPIVVLPLPLATTLAGTSENWEGLIFALTGPLDPPLRPMALFGDGAGGTLSWQPLADCRVHWRPEERLQIGWARKSPMGYPAYRDGDGG